MLRKKGVNKKNKDSRKTREKYKTEKKVIYKKVKKRRFKIKIHTVLIALLLLYLISCFIYYLINKPITNIYISGNTYYSDWEIIEKAGLTNYPASLLNSSGSIEKRLDKDILINDTVVKKTFFTRVYITITENRPLFYNNSIGKTVFMDKETSSDTYDAPTLVNTMSKNIYNDLIENLCSIDIEVYKKISEIKYDPDEVDDDRFLLTMTDGNYVYLTKLKFELLNDYNDIVKEFNNKKGILYLNSGGYFKILEN